MPLSFRAWISHLNYKNKFYENSPTFDKLRELEEALRSFADQRAPSPKITKNNFS